MKRSHLQQLRNNKLFKASEPSPCGAGCATPTASTAQSLEVLGRARKVIDPQPMARTPSTPLGVGLPVLSEKLRRLWELIPRLV